MAPTCIFLFLLIDEKDAVHLDSFGSFKEEVSC